LVTKDNIKPPYLYKSCKVLSPYLVVWPKYRKVVKGCMNDRVKQKLPANS
jgi:hypothetical protein